MMFPEQAVAGLRYHTTHGITLVRCLQSRLTISSSSLSSHINNRPATPCKPCDHRPVTDYHNTQWSLHYLHSTVTSSIPVPWHLELCPMLYQIWVTAISRETEHSHSLAFNLNMSMGMVILQITQDLILGSTLSSLQMKIARKQNGLDEERMKSLGNTSVDGTDVIRDMEL